MFWCIEREEKITLHTLLYFLGNDWNRFIFGDDTYVDLFQKEFLGNACLISLMLVKKEVSLKMAKMSYDHQKVAKTAYYAGEKRGTCRVNVLVSTSTNHFVERHSGGFKWDFFNNCFLDLPLFSPAWVMYWYVLYCLRFIVYIYYIIDILKFEIHKPYYGYSTTWYLAWNFL